MSDMTAALRNREIRKASAKAEWHERQGNHDKAMQWRQYANTLAGLVPTVTAEQLRRFED